MSLVGNLEDLSLGDILQIISLSQKSGVLALESTQGSGRILFQNGLIDSACVKGGAVDLQSLLVGGGIIDPAGFDACRSRTNTAPLELEEALIQETDLTEDRLETLKQEAVESAVFEMFGWGSGDFSFDVRSGTDPEDPKLILKAGANAQYLAMEGMRLLDERGRDGAGDASSSTETVAAPVPASGTQASETDAMGDAAELDSSEAAFQSLFGDEPLETGDLAVVSGGAEAVDPFAAMNPAEAVPLAPTIPEEEGERTAPHIVAARAIEQETPDVIELSPADLESLRKQPVVVIEPAVSGLEWMKAAIGSSFVRVHVFQKAEQGLSRIRQYMIRGEFPVVLISTAVEIDPLSGIHGLGDFVKRLKSQAARIRVIGIRERGDEDAPSKKPGISALDALLDRPSQRQVREWGVDENTEARATFTKSLQQALASSEKVGSQAAEEVAQTDTPTEIEHLRATTEKLQAASSRGEILPVVLAFASERFSRAAILVARDQEIFAVAGHGIQALEVDPLGTSQSVSVPAHEEGWIRSAVESGKPLQSPPQTETDRCLLERFGGITPSAAYLGPILSAGGVVAVLYGDMGDTGAAIPDVSSLEVVLHHAGVALDRAALERARWEADENVR